jgi:Icc-related predicted phosphoesterase
MSLKILIISDVELKWIHSPLIQTKFKDVDFVISCGDLPYDYLEYIISSLNVPLYYVKGNHAHPYERGIGDIHTHPWGGIDLHKTSYTDDSGKLLAGIQGSIRYNYGPCQYTQAEMWGHAFKLVPAFLINYFKHQRYLDILVTHAPSWGIHDQQDLPHQGVKAFHWLLQTFQPRYHLHGHVQNFHPNKKAITKFGNTQVINTHGYRVIKI